MQKQSRSNSVSIFGATPACSFPCDQYPFSAETVADQEQGSVCSSCITCSLLLVQCKSAVGRSTAD